jgi:hypothetical protein
MPRSRTSTATRTSSSPHHDRHGSTIIPELGGTVLQTFRCQQHDLIKRTYQSISSPEPVDVTRTSGSSCLHLHDPVRGNSKRNLTSPSRRQHRIVSGVGAGSQLPFGPERYQKHKLRVFPNYTFCTGLGNLNSDDLQHYDSGRHSVRVNQPYSAIQLPGQATPSCRRPRPSTSGRAAPARSLTSRFDLAFTYDIAIWKSIAPGFSCGSPILNTSYGPPSTRHHPAQTDQEGCNGAARSCQRDPHDVHDDRHPLRHRRPTRSSSSPTFAINAGIRF